jgi:hypothetical protein
LKTEDACYSLYRYFSTHDADATVRCVALLLLGDQRRVKVISQRVLQEAASFTLFARAINPTAIIVRSLFGIHIYTFMEQYICKQYWVTSEIPSFYFFSGCSAGETETIKILYEVMRRVSAC